MKKRLALLLVLTMVFALFGACTPSGDTTAPEDSASDVSTSPSASEVNFDEDPYEITFVYLVSTTFPDQEKINAALNDLALSEINMKVNVVTLTFGNWNEQLQLMLTSGEPLDVFPQNSNVMATYVDSGYVADLSSYEDVMPNTMQWVGMEDLSCCNVGGFIWGVTTMRERANPLGLVMRQDILDEVGVNADDLTSLDDVTELFGKVQEAYPDMTVFGGPYNSGMAHQGDMAGTNDPLNDELGVLANYGDNLTVVNEFEGESWRHLVDVARTWWVDGYTSKDMPTSNDSGEALMAAGNLFCYAANVKPNTAEEKKSQTGYDVAIYQVTDPLCSTTSTNGLGFCVSGTSQDEAKAVQFLDWLEGSAEANDLLNFGIEGEDWVEAADGTATFPEGVTLDNVGYHLDWGWAIPNQFAGHMWEGNDPNMYEIYQEFRDNAHKSKAYGFSFDSSSVTNEIIACQAVLTEYLPGIAAGSVDPDTEIAKMNEALYAAGLQTVMDEKQAQLNAWAEENNVN